jgi:hypothetical protein
MTATRLMLSFSSSEMGDMVMMLVNGSTTVALPLPPEILKDQLTSLRRPHLTLNCDTQGQVANHPLPKAACSDLCPTLQVGLVPMSLVHLGVGEPEL